ncbi:hypothetical protein Tco_1102359 [Tanacetum coccineum]
MEVVMTKERISVALVIGTCRVDKGSAAHDVSHCEVNFQMQGTKTLEVSKFIDFMYTYRDIGLVLLNLLYECQEESSLSTSTFLEVPSEELGCVELLEE